jgi:glucan phosphoethanolaminetransferase (alkaline phosphatase superfamily)
MTDADVGALDGYVHVRDSERDFEDWNADRLVIPELERIIESHEQSFSYVLKIGAHFPYSVRFPHDRAWFDESDVAAEYGAGRADTISDYLNTLRFGVDEFARELVSGLSALDREILVIYTADHGQSLFEPWGPDGRRVRGHGHSPDPPPYQARIPLFFIAIGERTRAAVASRYDESLRNRVSAFELFPTLLSLAGYADADIATRYGHTLFDLDADRTRRVFVSGNHFGADGPLYRDAPYRSSFGLNEFANP